jgi:hypothetical protein
MTVWACLVSQNPHSIDREPLFGFPTINDFKPFPIAMTEPFVVFGYGSLIFKVSSMQLTDVETYG